MATFGGNTLEYSTYMTRASATGAEDLYTVPGTSWAEVFISSNSGTFTIATPDAITATTIPSASAYGTSFKMGPTMILKKTASTTFKIWIVEHRPVGV